MTDRHYGKLDVMKKARDFCFSPRPRRQPISAARMQDKLQRMSKAALVSAGLSGGGGSSSVPIFDSLPDATSEDLGQIIYVAGAAGEPARGYIGVQTQSDTVIWEPIYTQGFYGAATEYQDEIYDFDKWTLTPVGAGSTTAAITPVAGHPGASDLVTGTTSGNRMSASLVQKFRLSDLDKAALIFRIGSITSNLVARIGLGTTVTGGTDGIMVEKLSAESNWRFVKTVSSVQTRTDSGISGIATSNWWLVQAEYLGSLGSYRIAVTDLTGSLGRASLDVSGLDETAIVFPFFSIETGDAIAKRLTPDYFWVRHRATVRS